MRISLNIENKMKMLSSMRNDSVFQILEYDTLEGATQVRSAMALKYMRESGMKLRQARIILDDSAIKIESGALSYLKGDVTIKSDIGGVLSFGKKFLSSKLTGETTVKPVLEGKGEVFLEPSFGHYGLLELEDEEIIIDDGLFYACENTVKVSTVSQKNVSSMLLGEEGVFQTKLSGSGIVLLELPVPESEIFRCKMYEDVLKIDGNFAILRTANIDFTVEKSGNSLIGSALNGEGLLNVYRGTGEVWLVPTKSIYNDIEDGNLEELISPEGSMNTEI